MAATAKAFPMLAKSLADKLIDLDSDTLKVALTNTAPNAATHEVLADITEISGGNGYTSGGADIQNDGTASTGTVTVTASR